MNETTERHEHEQQWPRRRPCHPKPAIITFIGSSQLAPKLHDPERPVVVVDPPTAPATVSSISSLFSKLIGKFPAHIIPTTDFSSAPIMLSLWLSISHRPFWVFIGWGSQVALNGLRSCCTPLIAFLLVCLLCYSVCHLSCGPTTLSPHASWVQSIYQMSFH